MRTLLIALLCLGVSAPLLAQRHLEFSLYTNATLLPGGGELGVFGWPIHPGLAGAYRWTWHTDSQHPWFQTARLSYHYHRYVQHSIVLMTELGRDWTFGQSPWGIQARLGAGYLHAIPATATFSLNESTGQYERKHPFGRPQWIAGLSLGPRYRLANGIDLLVLYQFYLEGVFVNEYVPLLPNMAWHLGASIPLAQ
ncbi:MAG: hypothetical protein KDC54_14275 [Lewinella sp.]|nr:hypothetical protein [Lewinella sp.]